MFGATSFCQLANRCCLSGKKLKGAARYKNTLTMEQQVFPFSWDVEGTTENMLQVIMPLKSIYYKNLGLNEQRCIFEL
jgi:hypothetical protein